MKISENLHALAAFIENAYLMDAYDFSNVKNLSDAKQAADELKNFVNSVNFLNEFNALHSRCCRELQVEELKRKGL